jgi:hypothetical protein
MSHLNGMSALASAAVEDAAHAPESGWDAPPRLYALVPTADLVRREPALAERLGLDAAAPGLTPVEQDPLQTDRRLEETLHAIVWPAEVAGCAAVLERLTLPPHAEAGLPDDPVLAQEYAAGHPDRQDVRIAVGVARDGTHHCVLRVRTHDGAVVQGPDLVPDLVRLLQATLED